MEQILANIIENQDIKTCMNNWIVSLYSVLTLIFFHLLQREPGSVCFFQVLSKRRKNPLSLTQNLGPLVLQL